MRRHGTRRRNSDADLIRICAEHIANVTTYNAEGGHLESADDPLGHAYERTRDAIHNAKSLILAGVRAIARAAKAEAKAPDGSERPEGCPAETWAWNLMDDLLRLAGEAA